MSAHGNKIIGRFPGELDNLFGAIAEIHTRRDSFDAPLFETFNLGGEIFPRLGLELINQLLRVGAVLIRRSRKRQRLSARENHLKLQSFCEIGDVRQHLLS